MHVKSVAFWHLVPCGFAFCIAAGNLCARSRPWALEAGSAPKLWWSTVGGGGLPSGDLVFYTILVETLQLCAIFDMHFWGPAGRGLGEGILMLFV